MAVRSLCRGFDPSFFFLVTLPTCNGATDQPHAHSWVWFLSLAFGSIQAQEEHLEIPEPSEVGLMFSAMAEAICDGLAPIGTMFSFFAKVSRKRTAFQMRNADPPLKFLSSA